jgi:UDP-N-acetylglucosamine 2-epimerase (non-hydrolysing)
MSPKKIILVAGARPNFMKIAPILRAFKKHSNLIPKLVHTGQHYDASMSGAFFDSLEIQKPDYNLEVGSGSHAVQTANIMVKFEEVCTLEKPDVVLVVGDVNSTIAAGLVAKKMEIGLAHVEAGLRSRDRAMPEEINRIATDAISDLFFTTEEEGTRNLLAEGHAAVSIYFVGHVMIDNLFYQLTKLKEKGPSAQVMKIRNALPEKYLCMTMHRPSNVDDKKILGKLLSAIEKIAENAPVVFPCHPRTKKQISAFSLESYFSLLHNNEAKINRGIVLLEPLDYNDFLYLWKDAAAVLTDSGGLQEETTALQIPCITMRENTERPVTAEIGSNVIVGTDPNKIEKYGKNALSGIWKKSYVPDLWDGKASERVAEVLAHEAIIS